MYLAEGVPGFSKLISNGNDAFVKTMVQENFAKVEVYFQTLNVINIAQSIAITVRSNKFLIDLFLLKLSVFIFSLFHLKLHS